jgi:hypothetical protein
MATDVVAVVKRILASQFVVRSGTPMYAGSWSTVGERKPNLRLPGSTVNSGMPVGGTVDELWCGWSLATCLAHVRPVWTLGTVPAMITTA